MFPLPQERAWNCMPKCESLRWRGKQRLSFLSGVTNVKSESRTCAPIPFSGRLLLVAVCSGAATKAPPFTRSLPPPPPLPAPPLPPSIPARSCASHRSWTLLRKHQTESIYLASFRHHHSRLERLLSVSFTSETTYIYHQIDWKPGFWHLLRNKLTWKQ